MSGQRANLPVDFASYRVFSEDDARDRNKQQQQRGKRKDRVISKRCAEPLCIVRRPRGPGRLKQGPLDAQRLPP